MRVNIMIEGQDGPSYEDLLAVARRAEDAGLSGMFRSDHYSSGQGVEKDSTDAWATLAGLARETRRLALGTLVSPATFRPIGNLAKVAATVSAMAGTNPDGSPRVSLGMGTGWMEVEHRRHGFPFEDLDTRFRRLTEQLEVLTQFWDASQQPFDYDGEFVTTADTRFTPVPDPRPRIVIGGAGMRRTPQLAARFADELNGVFLPLEDCVQQRRALGDACREEGRDPGSVTYSLMTRVIVGADREEVRSRAARYLERPGTTGTVDGWLSNVSPSWLVGTAEQVAEQLAALAAAGVEAVMAQHLLYEDLDMLDILASLQG